MSKVPGLEMIEAQTAGVEPQVPATSESFNTGIVKNVRSPKRSMLSCFLKRGLLQRRPTAPGQVSLPSM